MLYMSSSFWVLRVESRNFSQAEQIYKMTTIFTQKDNIGPLWVKILLFFEFAWLCKQFFLSQLENNHNSQQQQSTTDVVDPSGNNHFFTKSCLCQTYQNYEQPCQRSQSSDFQSHFSTPKIDWIFPIFFCKESETMERIQSI